MISNCIPMTAGITLDQAVATPENGSLTSERAPSHELRTTSRSDSRSPTIAAVGPRRQVGAAVSSSNISMPSSASLSKPPWPMSGRRDSPPYEAAAGAPEPGFREPVALDGRGRSRTEGRREQARSGPVASAATPLGRLFMARMRSGSGISTAAPAARPRGNERSACESTSQEGGVVVEELPRDRRELGASVIEDRHARLLSPPWATPRATRKSAPTAPVMSAMNSSPSNGARGHVGRIDLRHRPASSAEPEIYLELDRSERQLKGPVRWGHRAAHRRRGSWTGTRLDSK